MALWPWIDAIELVGPETADGLRTVAEKASSDLRRSIIVTAPLETMLMDALGASNALAQHMIEPTGGEPDTRLNALVSLNGLVVWLRSAKPSEWAKSVGIGW